MLMIVDDSNPEEGYHMDTIVIKSFVDNVGTWY